MTALDESCRVLVVDDNPTNVTLLVKSLERAGHEVRAATDGFAAVEVAASYQPDVILLDMMLPDRDGLEVCQILKSQEDTEAIPVIFVTAVSEPGQVLKAFEAGGSDYVTKPFRTAEVLARVSVQARLRHAERELLRKNRQTETLAAEVAEANVRLAHLSRSDPLTDLLNRRVLEEVAGQEHQRFLRHGSPYSILMIDVDHFKLFNDHQGHQAGDACLRRVARSLVSACRSSDYAGRYGGEEFAVVAPETDSQAGVKLAERIRRVVWNLCIPHPASTVGDRLTVSIGVGTAGAGSWEAVLKRADEALYVAKRAGRNMVYANHRSRLTADPLDTNADGDADADVLVGSDKPRALVLAADDDPATRVLCREGLEREGYEVQEASTGEEVLTRVAERPPDVIIMDAMMPGLDGLACTRRLKGDPGTNEIPIIMVGVRTDPADVLAGLNAGAAEYLTKPLRMNELAVRIRSAVRHYSEHKDLLRSYEFRGEQTRVLQCLLDFSRALSSSASLDEILGHALAVTAEVTGCQRISIMLPDPDQRFLSVARSLGIDEDIASTIRVPVGELVAGHVFASRRALVLNRENDTTFQQPAYDCHFFTSTPSASAPLGTDRVIGVLSMTERTGGGPFRQDDLEYIDLIAGIAGSAIQSCLSRDARNRAQDAIMVALAKLAEHRDGKTGRHVDRVTRYSLILAEELANKPGFRDHIQGTFLRDLERAVPLHDIGKVAVPDRILRKPSKLTPQEMTVMRTHAVVGADTIQSVVERTPGAGFLRMAADIARAHHEWYDGSGYPRGLARDAIPVSARIVALADVYDALTTKRVYKEVFGHAKAVTIIAGLSGTHFDPAVVEAFLVQKDKFRRLARDLVDNEEPAVHAVRPGVSDRDELLAVIDRAT